MTRSDCICQGKRAMDLLVAWNARAQPTIARLVRRGHEIDFESIFATRRLQKSLAGRSRAAFGGGAYGKSHHLPGCPFKGGRGLSDAG